MRQAGLSTTNVDDNYYTMLYEYYLVHFLQSADPYVTGGSAGSRASVPQTRLQKRG